jgi:hypothetical protein
VIAVGSTFFFYVNDQPIAEYTDSRLAAGKVAPTIEIYNKGDEANWEFDDFKLLVKPP